MIISQFLAHEDGMRMKELDNDKVKADLQRLVFAGSEARLINQHVEVKNDTLVLKAGCNNGVFDDPEWPEYDSKVIIAVNEEHAQRLFWNHLKG